MVDIKQEPDGTFTVSFTREDIGGSTSLDEMLADRGEAGIEISQELFDQVFKTPKPE
jgi:hypothetical protein